MLINISVWVMSSVSFMLSFSCGQLVWGGSRQVIGHWAHLPADSPFFGALWKHCQCQLVWEQASPTIVGKTQRGKIHSYHVLKMNKTSKENFLPVRSHWKNFWNLQLFFVLIECVCVYTIFPTGVSVRHPAGVPCCGSSWKVPLFLPFPVLSQDR